jgi:hypothetical protein
MGLLRRPEAEKRELKEDYGHFSEKIFLRNESEGKLPEKVIK